MPTDAVLLIILGALLILSPLVKSLMVRYSLPAPVGYVILGLLLGTIDHQWRFMNATFEYVFSVLAELGVVALLFRVGLRSRLKALVSKLPDASLLWLGDVSANLVIGFALAYYVLGLSLETALVIATAFSATSVAVSISVWDELNLLRSSSGILLIDVAELDDLSGVVLLTILLSIIPILQAGETAFVGPATTTGLLTLAKLLVFVALCYGFSHYLEEDFTHFNRRVGGDDTALIITILGAGLAISALAGLLGFSLAIGALFAGLAFSRDPEVVRNEGKFSYFYEFFAPFFFIRIGMQVEPQSFLIAADTGLFLFAAAAAGKLIGVATPALLLLNKAEALVLGISMIPRAEIALLIIYQCSQLGEGVVPQEVFAGMVVASLLTSVVAPPLVRFLLLQRTGK